MSRHITMWVVQGIHAILPCGAVPGIMACPTQSVTKAQRWITITVIIIQQNRFDAFFLAVHERILVCPGRNTFQHRRIPGGWHVSSLSFRYDLMIMECPPSCMGDWTAGAKIPFVLVSLRVNRKHLNGVFNGVRGKATKAVRIASSAMTKVISQDVILMWRPRGIDVIPPKGCPVPVGGGVGSTYSRWKPWKVTTTLVVQKKRKLIYYFTRKWGNSYIITTPVLNKIMRKP